MTFHRSLLLPAALVATTALALSGCAAAAGGEAEAGGDDGRIQVVAVTDVYGSIASAIGGDRVDVVSIVSGSAQDPHEYEASTRDQLEIAEADLVIVNGGGFDDFMDRLIDASGTTATVIEAVEVSGLLPEEDEAAEEEHDHAEEGDDHADEEGDDHGHTHIEGFNEHVWYSLHAVEHIAEAIEGALIELDPEGAADIRASSAAFLGSLEALHDRAHEVEEEIGGGDVVATEPVSGYLLADLGLVDVTPPAFLEAIEEGTGVGVGLLDEVLTLVGSGGIRMLAENTQSEGPEAVEIRAAATKAGVPAVAFSETLPSGEDYLSWMSANIEAVASALT